MACGSRHLTRVKGPGPLSRSTAALPVFPYRQGDGVGSGPFQGDGVGSGPFQGDGVGSGPFITGIAAIRLLLLVTAVFRPIAATKIKAGSSRTTCLRDIESPPEWLNNGRNSIESYKIVKQTQVFGL
jgi:hypothetical protein